MFKVLVVTTLFVAIHAVPVEHGHGSHHEVDYYTEPHYYFEYDVKDPHTGDVKSHKEQRKGDHTEGVYSLLEPGGSKRVVEYNVEGKKGGFVAKVHRGPVKLVDKKGHVGVGYANSNSFQKEVQEVVHKNHGTGGSYGGSHGGDSASFGGFNQLYHGNEGGSSGSLLGSFYSYGQSGQGQYGSSLGGSHGGGSGGYQHHLYRGNEGSSSGGSFGNHLYQPSYSLGAGRKDGSDSSSGESNEVGLSKGSFGDVYAQGYGGQNFKPSYLVREEEHGESSGYSAGNLQYSNQGNKGVSEGSLGERSLNNPYGSFYKNAGGNVGGFYAYGYRGSTGGSGGSSLGGYQHGNGGGSSVQSFGLEYPLLTSNYGHQGGSSGSVFRGAHSHGFGGHRLQPTYVLREGGHGSYQQLSQHGEGASSGGSLGSGSFGGYHLLSHNGGSLEGSFGNVYAHGYGGHHFQPSNLVREDGHGGLSSNYGSFSSENRLQYVNQGGVGSSFGGSHGAGLGEYQHGNEGSLTAGALGSGYHLLSSNYGHVGGSSGSALGGVHSHGFGGHRLQPTYALREGGQGVSSSGLSHLGNVVGSGSVGGYNLLSAHTGTEGGSSSGSLGGVDAYGFQSTYVGGHAGGGQDASSGGYQVQSSHRGYEGGLSGGSLGSGSLKDYQQLSYGGVGASSGGSLGTGSSGGYHLFSHNGNQGGSSEGSFGNVYAHGYGQNVLGSSVHSLGTPFGGFQQGNEAGLSAGSLGGGYPHLSSNYGHVGASSGGALGGVHSHGFGGHRLQPAYVSRKGKDVGPTSGYGSSNGGSSSVHGGNGNDQPTSKVTYSTNGAKVYTSTKHLSPKKYGY